MIFAYQITMINPRNVTVYTIGVAPDIDGALQGARDAFGDHTIVSVERVGQVTFVRDGKPDDQKPKPSKDAGFDDNVMNIENA